MKNILLIGGAGFIGSNLIKSLLKEGVNNIFVYEPHLANISRLNEFHENITIIRGVLADYDLIESILIDHGIETVIHLVSTLIPGSNYDDYKREYERVIFPSIRLMGICSDRKIKFVFFSSGGTIYGNSINGKFKETDQPSPISYYGLSKQVLENNILFEHRVKNLNYLIIRPSNPYGPGQSLNGEQGFIAVAIGRILGNQPLTVWGDGGTIRDYIYIDNLAEYCIKLLQNQIENEIINIGSGEGHTINDIISRLKQISKHEFNVDYINKRSVDVNQMILNIDKLENYLEVSKPISIDEGIELFYNYACQIIQKR